MRAINPTVSVIIPTYNRGHSVGRAIQSVLNQTYQDIEIIAVDDASKDNTKDVISNFNDKRIKYIRHNKNKGGGAARNTGIKSARGEYIAFLDSDDEWLPEKLEKIISLFEKKSKVIGVIFSGLIWLNPNEKKPIFDIPQIDVDINQNIVFKNLLGPLSSTIVRRECFEKCGYFDERLPAGQDWDIWIKIAKKYRFAIVKEALGLYYCDGERISTDMNNKAKGHRIILEKYYEEIIKNRKGHSELRFKIATYLLKAGQLHNGRIEFLKAIRTYPFRLKYFLYLFCSFLGLKTYRQLSIYKNKEMNS